MSELVTATLRLSKAHTDGSRSDATIVPIENAVLLAGNIARPGLVVHRAWYGTFLPGLYAFNHFPTGTLITDLRCANHTHLLSTVLTRADVDWTSPSIDVIRAQMAAANLFETIDAAAGPRCGGPLCSPIPDLPDVLKEKLA